VINSSFTTFFSASAGCGAALAGLLFLAVTVGPVPTVGRHAPVERRAVATSAFVALVNAFLLSLGALLPGSGYGIIALPVAGGSLLATLRTGSDLAQGQSGRSVIRREVLVVVSVVLYTIEAWQGVQLLDRPVDTGPVAVIASLLLIVYAVAILRAWELVGAERHGILARFSPLRDLDP
jgi:hypothetical protein